MRSRTGLIAPSPCSGMIPTHRTQCLSIDALVRVFDPPPHLCSLCNSFDHRDLDPAFAAEDVDADVIAVPEQEEVNGAFAD